MIRRNHCVAWLILVSFAFACMTPRPLDDAERRSRADADLAQMFDGVEPAGGKLDLYTAMARALRFNLDQRVELMQQALSDRQIMDARLDLLPRLLASNEYYGRNNEHGAVSESLLTGAQSLEASTSQERYGFRRELTLAFSVLDFGLSWVRASQEANEALIARERRSKAAQDLLVDVRRSYWLAVGAQELLPELDRIEKDARDALVHSQELEEERLLEPLQALAYRRSMLDRLRELDEMRVELERGKVELAALMRVRPGTPLELETPSREELPLPEMDVAAEILEQEALVSRPELREADYRKRIDRLEVRRAMLTMLPGIELRMGKHGDTNEYLYNDDWMNYSAVLSKNLMEIVTAPSEIAVARSGAEVGEARRLALGMAVLAQVHIARQELEGSRRGLELAGGVRDLEGRLHDVTQEFYDAERESELELVRRSTNRAVADLRWWVAYSEHQEAYGRLLGSVGVSPVLEDRTPADTAEIGRSIRRSLERWRRRVDIARDYPDAQVPAHQPPAEPGG